MLFSARSVYSIIYHLGESPGGSRTMLSCGHVRPTVFLEAPVLIVAKPYDFPRAKAPKVMPNQSAQIGLEDFLNSQPLL